MTNATQVAGRKALEIAAWHRFQAAEAGAARIQAKNDWMDRATVAEVRRRWAAWMGPLPRFAL